MFSFFAARERMLLKKVSFLDERKCSFVIKFFDAKFVSETGLSFWSLLTNDVFATLQRSLARS